MKRDNITFICLSLLCSFFNTVCMHTQQERFGIFYHQKCNYEQACNHYFKALKDNPRNITVLYNLSLVLTELGKFDESQQALETIIQQQPSHKNAKRKLVLHYLRNKEWQKSLPLLSVDDYWWYNEDITNKKMLIRHDGGFGDAIQFIRYAKRLHEAGADVTVETQQCSFLYCPVAHLLIH